MANSLSRAPAARKCSSDGAAEFLKVPKALRERVGLPWAAKALVAHLRFRQRDRDEISIGQRQLAKDLGMSLNAVARATKQARKRRLLRVLKPRTQSGSRRSYDARPLDALESASEVKAPPKQERLRSEGASEVKGERLRSEGASASEVKTRQEVRSSQDTHLTPGGDAPETPENKTKPTAKERLNARAEELVNAYRSTVKPASLDNSGARGRRNASNLLLDGQTFDRLMLCIQNCAEACASLGTEQQFRNHVGNFFGRDRIFEGYLPENYKKPSPQGQGQKLKPSPQLPEAKDAISQTRNAENAAPMFGISEGNQ